ncbi:unnamed protein product, partial [Durusdinium trenchii]
DSGEDGDARCSASLLWRWLGRCLEGEAVPDVVLLQEAVTDPKDRVRLFATLSDKTVGEVGALHLTRATLDSRVADATLPLLATFEEFAEALPSKAALDAIDLLQLPGFLSALRVEHSLRHQVAALLACVLLSISDERRRWTYYGARRPWVDEDGELRQRRGKLDVADVAYLRCLMRRYGWERSAGG